MNTVEVRAETIVREERHERRFHVRDRRAGQLARIVAAVGLLTTLRAAPVRAQDGPAVGIAAGVLQPIGDYGSDKRLGWTAGLLVSVPIYRLPLTVRVDGNFGEVPLDGTRTKLQLWSATANLLVVPRTSLPIAPYALGGIGFLNTRRNVIIVSDSRTTLALTAGLGVRFPNAPVPLFIEARLLQARTDNVAPRFLPIVIGVGY